MSASVDIAIYHVDKSNAPRKENNRTVSQTEGAGMCANAPAPQLSPKAGLVRGSYGHHNGGSA
jgi:hypothetical protein